MKRLERSISKELLQHGLKQVGFLKEGDVIVGIKEIESDIFDYIIYFDRHETL